MGNFYALIFTKRLLNLKNHTRTTEHEVKFEIEQNKLSYMTQDS